MSFRDLDEIRKEEYKRQEEKIDIANVDKVKIDFASSDVNIFFTDENEIKVVQYSYQELKGDETFKIDKSSSNITISKKSNKNFHFFYMNQIVFDIYIPNAYEESLEVKTVSGDIKGDENLKFKNLTMSSTSGDIEMANVEADNINLETVSGEIKLQNIGNNTIKLKTVSGDILVESAKGNIEAKSTSGNIEIEKIEGEVELNSTSGEIESDDFKITGNSKVKTTSGNVRMYLNEESNCQIQTKTVSGNVTFPNGRNVVGQEPYLNLNIQTTSGNIKVEEKK